MAVARAWRRRAAGGDVSIVLMGCHSLSSDLICPAMALHRLTSITLGVPDVAASRAFFHDFGLTGSGMLATRDGGEQLELVPSANRSLHRLGVGTDDADDLGRIAGRVERSGLGSVVESTSERLVLAEPVTGLLVEITQADPYAATPMPHTFNRPGVNERFDVPAESVLTADPVTPSNLTHVVYGTPDQPTTLQFFTEVLGFEISDQVPGIIAVHAMRRGAPQRGDPGCARGLPTPHRVRGRRHRRRRTRRSAHGRHRPRPRHVGRGPSRDRVELVLVPARTERHVRGVHRRHRPHLRGRISTARRIGRATSSSTRSARPCLPSSSSPPTWST